MTISSCDGTPLVSGMGGAFTDGYGPVLEAMCLAVDLSAANGEGVMVYVGGGFYPSEVSWTLGLPSGESWAGGAGLTNVMCAEYQGEQMPAT